MTQQGVTKTQRPPSRSPQRRPATAHPANPAMDLRDIRLGVRRPPLRPGGRHPRRNTSSSPRTSTNRPLLFARRVRRLQGFGELVFGGRDRLQPRFRLLRKFATLHWSARHMERMKRVPPHPRASATFEPLHGFRHEQAWHWVGPSFMTQRLEASRSSTVSKA